MPVALLNYLDRQMLASMKTSVMADIPSIGNNENWGFMLGQFKWVYAVFSLIGGYIADRFSRRYVICTSLLVWSIVTWSTAHASTYNQLLWVRSLMGISEAFYMPAALALIADYHIGNTRSRAIGFHQMAIYCGVILGGFGGYVAADPDWGWRFTFTACGVFGVLYSLPLVAFLRDAPESVETDATAKSTTRFGVLELVTNFSFILLVLYFTLPAMAGWVVRDWMPAILKDEFNIDQGKAGVVATIYWQAAAIVGAIAGGWLADRWMRRSDRGRIYAECAGNVPDCACNLWCRKCRIFELGCRVFGALRTRLGLFRLQQHANSVADRSPALARHRLWNHELRQHLLRWNCRLGLRQATRSTRSAERDLRYRGLRGSRVDRHGAAHSTEARAI